MNTVDDKRDGSAMRINTVRPTIVLIDGPFRSAKRRCRKQETKARSVENDEHQITANVQRASGSAAETTPTLVRGNKPATSPLSASTRTTGARSLRAPYETCSNP